MTPQDLLHACAALTALEQPAITALSRAATLKRNSGTASGYNCIYTLGTTAKFANYRVARGCQVKAAIRGGVSIWVKPYRFEFDELIAVFLAAVAVCRCGLPLPKVQATLVVALAGSKFLYRQVLSIAGRILVGSEVPASLLQLRQYPRGTKGQ